MDPRSLNSDRSLPYQRIDNHNQDAVSSITHDADDKAAKKAKMRKCIWIGLGSALLLTVIGLLIYFLGFYSKGGNGSRPDVTPKPLPPDGFNTPDPDQQQVVLQLDETTINFYWELWKITNGQQYDDPKTEQYRKGIYTQNLTLFMTQMSQNRDVSYNFFDQTMAMTGQEIENKFRGANLDVTQVINSTGVTLEFLYVEWLNQSVAQSITNPPKELDWCLALQLNIRNQKCGDCWANAATTVLEALWQIEGHPYEEFSVQQEIDCGKLLSQNMNGCEGGFPAYAWANAQMQGAALEKDYPYNGYYSEKCLSPSAQRKYPVYKYQIFPDAETDGELLENCHLLRQMLSFAPVAVLIDANPLQTLTGSWVSLGTKFGNPNHAVVVVGYTEDYWIVQNSWGTERGENGIYYFEMGNTLNICVSPEVAYTENMTSTVKPSLRARVPNEIYYREGMMDIRSVLLANLEVQAYLYLETNEFVLGDGFKFVAFSPNYVVQPSRAYADEDSQYLRLTFVDDVEEYYFYVYFYLDEESGVFVSDNIVNDYLILAQCGVNDELLGDYCIGEGYETFYVYTNDQSQNPLIYEFKQSSVAKLANRLRARRRE